LKLYVFSFGYLLKGINVYFRGYRSPDIGGGLAYTSYFSYTTKNNPFEVKYIGKVLSENRIYFACRKVLQITKEAIYTECSGGDGTGGTSGLYVLSFETAMTKELKSCSILSGEVTCKR